jgi:hypothetical protein
LSTSSAECPLAASRVAQTSLLGLRLFGLVEIACGAVKLS